MRKRVDKLSTALDGERSRASAVDAERQEWSGVRADLERRLAEAQSLNESVKEELERMQFQHEQETRQLRDELSGAQRGGGGGIVGGIGGPSDPDLGRENQELRESLRRQQQVTDEVRREAQEFLREMRALSQQSGATYEKQAEMERTMQQLEREAREWRNRYARAKTQARSMRSSSLGLGLGADDDASQCLRDKGFVDDGGLVKDVHVTRFQIAVDELLQTARRETADRVTEAMKLVVVSVRRITRDVDEAAPDGGGEAAQQHARLKAKVSSTANGLITASKNFGAAAGLSPVSLLDAAASHLCAAIIDLLRAVKIRATPAGELDDDDDGGAGAGGSATPVDAAAGFMSPRSATRAPGAEGLPPPPPPFQGLGGARASAESSAYSPVNSPRESAGPYSHGGGGGVKRDGRAGNLEVRVSTRARRGRRG